MSCSSMSTSCQDSSTIDSAGLEDLDGMKVENDRLGQLGGRGRHESRHIFGLQFVVARLRGPCVCDATDTTSVTVKSKR